MTFIHDIEKAERIAAEDASGYDCDERPSAADLVPDTVPRLRAVVDPDIAAYFAGGPLPAGMTADDLPF